MEEALKSLKIGLKILVKRLNAMWNNLMATGDETRRKEVVRREPKAEHSCI